MTLAIPLRLELERSSPAPAIPTAALELVSAAVAGDVVATQRLLTSVTPRMTRVVARVRSPTVGLGRGRPTWPHESEPQVTHFPRVAY